MMTDRELSGDWPVKDRSEAGIRPNLRPQPCVRTGLHRPLTRSYPLQDSQSGGDPGISARIALNCWDVISRKSLTVRESV